MNNILAVLEILKYGIIIVVLLGLTASLLSPFVVLNDQSLIADGLSHVSFMALALGFLLVDEPLIMALPIVILASLVIKWLSSNSKIGGDASIGLVSSIGFAVGLILIKYNNSTIDLESLISGNLWLRTSLDVILAVILFIIVGVFVLLNYRKMIMLTFDFGYAKFSKIKANLLSYTFAALTAIFVLIGVRSIGVLLISSLLIFPLVTANLVSKSFKELFLFGSIFSTISILTGVFLAHILNLPTGSVIVILYTLILVLLTVVKKIIKKVTV